MRKFIAQRDQMDCGPACLAMVTAYYGKSYPLPYLRDSCYLSREGVSLLSINEAAKSIGFDTICSKIDLATLRTKELLPCILYWNQNHFVVLYKVQKSLFSDSYSYTIADPGYGRITLSEKDFVQKFISDTHTGIALFLTPTQGFHTMPVPQQDRLRISDLLRYLRPYRWQMLQVFISLLAGTLFSLAFPFLTQALIDKGVTPKQLSVVGIILLAQVGVFLGSMGINMLRNWIMLYVGARINIMIISDFLKKILQLPVRFFDTKFMGDFTQRIHDHDRIERFLTSESIFTLFSVINFSIFFGVLLYYSPFILLVFSIGTGISIGWTLYFLRRRKFLDYYRFQNRSENQESMYEMINGIQEIKLNHLENTKITHWESIQVKLFGIQVRILRLDQLQQTGFECINQLKNILVTFLAASYVVQDSLTLGELMSISYITGQMNSPVYQLVAFFRTLQDARLSMERLDEVNQESNEETDTPLPFSTTCLPQQQGIHIRNLSFQYEGPKSPFVLKNLNLFIPQGQTTAIVGESGSGKTTLLKVLLKFYEPTQGYIEINGMNSRFLSARSWREQCGTVLQDGYIFADTIEKNITTSDASTDNCRFNNAIQTANLTKFLVSLPLRENTRIGLSGNGISGGQKQRILIARAVYKDPLYIFFDEATSALDAENEKMIHDRLQEFFTGKTVVIIAHRLSTVKNADQIIVLKDGQLAEQGTHQQLIETGGVYFDLVKNQLELSL